MGYEHGFLLSHKENYIPTEGNEFNLDYYLDSATEDNPLKRQLKFPTRALLVQGGFLVDKNIDVKLTFKVDLASPEIELAGGIGIGYYF